MPTINSLPNGASFGTQFDYSVWGPGTEVTLCNVPWDGMYRDVYWFDTPEKTIEYIRSFNSNKDIPTVTIKALTYCAQNVPVRISLPFSEANTYNYLIVQNSAFPIGQKNRATTFFYFIQSVDYVAPETTQLTISLDVWQTYHHLIKFGDAFVERSHQLEWTEKKLLNNESDRNTKWLWFAKNNLKANESFNLGERHAIYRSWLASMSDDYGKFDNRYDFTAIIVSTVELAGTFGSKDNPILNTAVGSKITYMVGNDTITGSPRPGGVTVSGANMYQCSLSALPKVMKALSATPWIAQGIIDIYLVPKPNVKALTFAGPTGEAGLARLDTVFTNKNTTITDGLTCPDHVSAFKARGFLSERHITLLKRFSKFFTAPYTYYEVSVNNGQTITISPERLTSLTSIGLRMEYHLLPPSPRIVMHIYGHNSMLKTGLWKGDMEYVNEAITVDNFPHVPVVNDSSSIWYASNARSIAQNRSSASWGLDKSRASAANSFDATMRGVATGNAIMNNNLGAQNLNTALANTAQMAHQQVGNANRAISGIGGAAMTALASPGAGIMQLGGFVQNQITSDITNGIDINARNMGNVISQNTTRANQSESNALTTANATANRDLANWAAQGDYQQAIGAINASVRDSEITPPSVAGATGGDSFNWLINGAVIQTRMRMVSPDVILNQGAFWERYGYAVNYFLDKLPEKLKCMDRFTYWKCQNVRASSSAVPQVYIESIRGMLEKGVTVWHEPLRDGETVNHAAAVNSPINWEQ